MLIDPSRFGYICAKIKTDDSKRKSNQLIEGFIVFELLRPNAERTKLIKQKKLKLTQTKFVEFLISGNIDEAETLNG